VANALVTEDARLESRYNQASVFCSPCDRYLLIRPKRVLPVDASSPATFPFVTRLPV